MIVIAVWVFTALTVWVLVSIHPPASVDVSLTVGEFSFSTGPGLILNDAYEEQLLISGIAALDISGEDLRVSVDDRNEASVSRVAVRGDPSFSCSFYHVRSTRPELKGPSRVTLALPPRSKPGSFSFKSHGAIAVHVTSQPASESGQPSHFGCTQAIVDGVTVQHIDGRFPAEGGSVAEVVSSSDVRIDFRGAVPADFVDTQIPILQDLRFSTVRPGPDAEEKTTLLPPPPGLDNEVVFEGAEPIRLNEGDLLVIEPERNSPFYLKRFGLLQEGIRLSLGGTARDLRIGPGSASLQSRKPSLLDALDTKARVFALVPALAALVFEILDRMGRQARQ